MRFLTPSPPGHHDKNRFQTEKAETLADSLVISSFRSWQLLRCLTWCWGLLYACQRPKLTNSDEIQVAIGDSTSAKLQTHTVSRAGLWNIFPSERYTSWYRFSMGFSALVISLLCVSTLVWSLSSIQGLKIRAVPRPYPVLPSSIGPLVALTRLVNYLKRFY